MSRTHGKNGQHFAAWTWYVYALVSCCILPEATANEWTVTTSLDQLQPPPGLSLRQAITQQATADGDTVKFANDVNPILSLGVIEINKNLTIDGGEVGVSIESDPGAQQQLFKITTNASATFQKVTFKKGNAARGGAIENNDGVLTLRECTFLNNQATFGGALYSFASIRDEDAPATLPIILTITDCTFSGNFAGCHGGAIYAFGRNVGVQITGCTIKLNTANDGHGGGVMNEITTVSDAVTMTIDNTLIGDPDPTDSIFEGNETMTGGGGVANGEGAELHITNGSRIQGNKTTNGVGGGIYNLGKLTITRSTIYRNEASGFEGDGGGIFNGPDAGGSGVHFTRIKNSVVTENIAERDGGGIYNEGLFTIGDKGSSSPITDVMFNRAGGDGGGIYNMAGGTANILKTARIGSNDAYGTSSTGGGISNGGILLVDGTQTTTAYIFDNKAGFGAAIYTAPNTTATLNKLSIDGNTAGFLGGGIYWQNATLIILVNVIWSGNTPQNDYPDHPDIP